MQHDITKTCADFLRSYFSDEYGIKLKSGHAHEMVAAFFGFKSRIAMLADKKHIISDWDRAEFILLAAPISLIDQRFQNLRDLSPGLPPSHVLSEVVYSILVAQLYLCRELRKLFKSGFPSIKWKMGLNIEHRDDETLFTVDVGYHTETGEHLRYGKYIIHLPRIATDLGYGIPKVSETYYSGGARKYDDDG